MLDKEVYFEMKVIITMILVNLFIFICAIYFLNLDPYVFDSYNQIKSNWNRRILLDIKLGQDKCPYGYEPVSLGLANRIVNAAPGTIPQSRTENIYYWRGNIICAKMGLYGYLSQSAVLSNGRCKRHRYTCPHPYDTLNEYMCVKHPFECGINDIKIIPKAQSYNSTLYTKLDFADGYNSLIFARLIPNKPVIVDFQVVKGQICSNPVKRDPLNSITAVSDYKYFNCFETIDGSTTNKYWILLDTGTLTYSFMTKYFGIFNDQFEVNLFYSTYIGLANYCTVDYTYTNKILPKINDLIDIKTSVMTITMLIMCCGILFFLLQIKQFRRNRYKWDKPCQVILFIFGSSLNFCLLVIVWIFDNSYRDYYVFKYVFDYYKGYKCFDSYHTKQLALMEEKTAHVVIFVLLIGLWSIFAFLSPIIYALFFACFENCTSGV
jgi:hypothetical protein